MPLTFTRRHLLQASAAIALATPALAQKRYDTGASDSEIKIGHIGPYSGPASSYGEIGKTIAAYVNKVNDDGGINGRKLKFISYDDAYSPPKTVEQARKLVESDEVLFLFQSLGTAHNIAIQKYMNAKKVPQLFVATGASNFDDPKAFPWTMGWQPNYQIEGRIYAAYLLANAPDAKICALYQNDDFGKDLLKGLKAGLGPKASNIISEVPYEVADPTLDSQMIRLKASGAEVFVSVTTPKAAAQAIRKAADLNWKPIYLQSNVGSSQGSVLKPAGYENATGIFSTNYLKSGGDPSWAEDPGMKRWAAFMAKYYPDGDRDSQNTVYGYAVSQVLMQVLKQAGDELTRANVMKQAASIKDFEADTLLPGIKMNTSAEDYSPIKQMQMMKFAGDHWQLFGPVISGGEKRA